MVLHNLKKEKEKNRNTGGGFKVLLWTLEKTGVDAECTGI